MCWSHTNWLYFRCLFLVLLSPFFPFLLPCTRTLCRCRSWPSRGVHFRGATCCISCPRRCQLLTPHKRYTGGTDVHLFPTHCGGYLGPRWQLDIGNRLPKPPVQIQHLKTEYMSEGDSPNTHQLQPYLSVASPSDMCLVRVFAGALNLTEGTVVRLVCLVPASFPVSCCCLPIGGRGLL